MAVVSVSPDAPALHAAGVSGRRGRGAVVAPRRAAGGLLTRLRRRLTLAFGCIALVGFGLLVVMNVAVDMDRDADRLDVVLRGQAARAAALVYLDQEGIVELEAVQDDHVAQEAYGLLVFGRGTDASPTLLYSLGAVHGQDWRDLAAASMVDTAETGVWADDPQGRFRGAAMPWFSDDTRVGGATVVVAPRDTLSDSDVFVPSLLGAAVLLVMLTGLVWWLAGASMRPAEAALADRERFLATAADELQGPLDRLRSGAEVALRSLPPGATVSSDLRGLVTTAGSAGRVVSNLLLASRIDHDEVPVTREPLRLDEVAAEVEGLVDGVIVDVAEPVTVMGDASLLRHAMINLVDNAIRHGTRDRPPTVILAVRRHDGEALVRVSDDGPGFPPGLDVTRAYAAHTGGAGLGLSLVAWIAQRHEATLRLPNTPGSGGGSQVDARSVESADGLGGAVVEMVFGDVTPARPFSPTRT